MTAQHDSLIDKQLAQELESGALLLTANRRLARAYSSAYDQGQIEAGESVWQTPTILPLESWWQSLHLELQATGLTSARLLSAEQEQALWRASIESKGDGGALLSVAATAKALMKAWRTEHAFELSGADWSSYLTPDQQAYRRWSAEYRRLCEAGDFIDMARLPDLLLSLLESQDPAFVMPRQLHLRGFLQQTPQLQRFVAHCRQLGVVVASENQSALPTRRAQRTACIDAQHELKCAARWARGQLESANHAQQSDFRARRVAIVISDLHLRRTQVQRCFDEVFFAAATPAEINQHGRSYEISLGQNLDRFAPVASALRVLQLGFDCLQGADITECLLSPYIANAETEKQARALFDLQMRARGFKVIRLYQLIESEFAPAQLRKILRQLQSISTNSELLPSQWLPHVLKMLQVTGWPGDSAPQSEEYQAIEAWRNCLHEIAQLDELLGKVSGKRMLALIQELTRARVFQVQSSTAPIQIMGTLEMVGQKFDAAWVAGFDNENWPQAQRATPFLPLKWQKQVNAPGASQAWELSMSQRMIDAFTSAATETIFSYPLAINGNAVDAAWQIQSMPQVDVGSLLADGSTSAIQRVFDSVTTETIADHAGPPIDPSLPAKGGARLFEDQALCPFKSFAHHRLRIRPLEEPALGIDARDKGNFFHEAMALFWTQTKSLSALESLTEEALDLRIDECIDGAIEIAMSEQDRQRRAALLKIEKNRLKRVIHSWIDYFEKKRAPFCVEQVEQESEVEFEALKLTLKLDRVDKLADGGRVIIDYKTGKNNPVSSWMEERITRAQLPLYAVILEDIRAVCFAQVATNKQRFSGMAAEKNLLAGLQGPNNENNSWSDRLASWQQNLAKLAQEINTGHAAVVPTKNACQYCDFSPLCRIEKNALLDATQVGTD